MARNQMTAALLLVAGMVGMSGCNDSKVTGGVDNSVQSTYGNVTDWDENAWTKRPAPAPAPAPMKQVESRPAPAPAPAPQMAGNCMYLPTGDKITSALSVCCNMPSEVTAGKNFTYDLTVCNLTGMSLSNVVVSYSLNGANIVSSDPSMTGGGFAVGDMAPKACKTIKITAAASGTGTVKGCTSATWANALCCGTNVVSPALKIVKSVTPTDGVTKCDVITYTITVTNSGTGNASNVKIHDDLPNGVKTSDGRTVVDQSVGTLAAGQSQTITFQAMLPKEGTYSNTASAMADNGLTATSAPATVNGVQSVLTVTRACPKEAYMTRSSCFDVTVTNSGSSTAKGVVVEDTMPAGSKFISASDNGSIQGGKIVWNVGDLAAKASKTVKICYNLLGEHNSMVTTTSTARATCADPATATCQTKIIGAPDIGTSITDDNGVVMIGDTHVFRYEVKNQGQIDLTNVTMVAELDNGLDYQSTDWAGGGTAAGQKITFKIGTLKVGQKVNFNIVVKGSKEGEMIIKSMTTATETREVRNDEQVNYVPAK